MSAGVNAHYQGAQLFFGFHRLQAQISLLFCEFH
jgi:hypothetical protein